eukprot:Nk52_evm63s78 gene=Nk52_evmTU63s78
MVLLGTRRGESAERSTRAGSSSCEGWAEFNRLDVEGRGYLRFVNIYLINDDPENFPVIPKKLLLSPIVLYLIDVHNTKVMDYGNFSRLRSIVRKIKGELISSDCEDDFGGQLGGERLRRRVSLSRKVASLFTNVFATGIQPGSSKCQSPKKDEGGGFVADGLLLKVIQEAKRQILCWTVREGSSDTLVRERRKIYGDTMTISGPAVGNMDVGESGTIPMFEGCWGEEGRGDGSRRDVHVSLTSENVDLLVCQCVMYLSVCKVTVLFKAQKKDTYTESRQLYDPNGFQWMSFINYLFCFTHNCQQVTREQLKDPGVWTDMFRCLEGDGIYFKHSFESSFWLFKHYFGPDADTGRVVEDIIKCIGNTSVNDYQYELFNLFNEQQMSLYPTQIKPIVYYICFLYQTLYTFAFPSLQPSASVFEADSHYLPAQLHHYRILKSLGPGSSDFTYRGIDLKTGKDVAVKVLRKGGLGQMTRIDGEISALSSLHHNNIARLENTLHSESKVFLILECCEGGSLDSYSPVSERTARHMFIQILEAIRYCHGKGICHRDLRLENLLLLKSPSPKGASSMDCLEHNLVNNSVKLIDFGHCGVFAKGWDMFQSTVTGSLLNVAPELLTLETLGNTLYENVRNGNMESSEESASECSFYSHHNISTDSGGCYSGKKLDMWACGVILYQLLYGTPPFVESSAEKLVSTITSCEVKFPDDDSQSTFSPVSSAAKELIKALLSKNPKQRPSARRAFEYPWLSQQ